VIIFYLNTGSPQARPASAASQKSVTGPPHIPELDVAKIPDAPQIPSPDREESELEGTMSNTALVGYCCMLNLTSW